MTPRPNTVWPNRCRAGLLIFIFLTLCPRPNWGQDSPPRPTTYAATIGLNKYGEIEKAIRTNPGAYRNAVELAETFASAGFDVRSLTNEDATYANLLTLLRRLALETTPSDVVIVYLSGIVFRNASDKKLYYLTYDARLSLLEANAIRLERLRDLVNDIPARRRLILVDAILGGEVRRTRFLETGGRFSIEVSEASGVGDLSKELSLSRESALLLHLRLPIAPVAPEVTLTSLTRQALSGAKGDLNLDGELSVMELKQLLENALATEAGSRLAFLGGADGDWSISRLRTGTSTDRIATYKETLNQWRLQGWLSVRAHLQAATIFDGLPPDLHLPSAMDPDQRRLLNQTLQILDAPSGGKDRAEALERLLAGSTKVGLIVAQKPGCTAARVADCDDVWDKRQQRALTYCVSVDFGERYQRVVRDMEAATEAWEAAANVDFIHVASHDGSCTAQNEGVVFDVRPVNEGMYLTRGFFPHEPRRDRNILIDESALSLDPAGKLQLVGTLRHALGNVLGFRNEHTRPEAGTCFEDNDWRPLSKSGYNPYSVMHYPQCNGLGDWSLTLTESDRNGAACLYGPAAGFAMVNVVCGS